MNTNEPSKAVDERKSYQTLTPSDVYTLLGTQAEGLSTEEASERLARYGPNAIREIKGKPLILKFLANFTHLMAIMIWVAGIMSFIAQMPQLGIAVWMVNIINGAFSFWQEFRAEKATQALKKLLPSYARVIRNGEQQRILAEELVAGDVVLLEEGDRISADARVVEQNDLQTDQSTLTGESRPVRKTGEAVLRTDLSLAEVPNLIFAGTSVAAGTGQAVVFATGMNTEFGKIATLTQSVEEALSPLQMEMKRVTKTVTLIAVGIGIVFFIISLLLAGMRLAEAFIFAIGMIVAFVPEGLLPTVTLALAMGVQRMVGRHALIKRLSAVETLGCTSVICTDKTGTLTQNEMTVSDIWLGGHYLGVSGVGYAPEGLITEEDERPLDSLAGDLRDLCVAAGLCNNARLLPPDEESARWTVLGDPTEAALRVAASKAGLDLDEEYRAAPRLRELPFDSRRKRMSTIHQVRDPDTGGFRRLAYIKGAPKEVLMLCNRIRMEGQERSLDTDLYEEIMAANDDLARKGLRVLAIATRPMPENLMSGSPETIERDITFLGLMAMMDPPRPEVFEGVQKCHHAGIRVVMITGDYGLTAESIARKIGIIQGEQPRIVTGVDLEEMDEAALEEALKGEVIFARVAPEHKLRVVNAMQALGNVVAVTGDGVNDAPALKKADIGVAMGIAGTDVAKEAADMILTDDNFASIVNAVEEGRAVYANIKKFATYIFTSNTPEAVPFVAFAFSAARIPLALNVMHILSIDLGTDLVPALGLGAEPPEPGTMDHPPRSLSEHVINWPMLVRAYFWLGPIQSLAAMAAFYYMYWTNGYWGQFLNLPASGPLYASATAMALASVVVTQIGNVFTQRTERTSIRHISLFSNRIIWIGIASELALIVLITYTPILNFFIGTGPFPLQNWLFLFAWLPSLVILDEIRKAIARRRKQSAPIRGVKTA
jgi:Ca2+-transporting ATPase